MPHTWEPCLRRWFQGNNVDSKQKSLTFFSKLHPRPILSVKYHLNSIPGVANNISTMRHAVRVGVRVTDVDDLQQLQAAHGHRRRVPF